MTEPDLFVGVPINPKIQESLDAASLPFRRYFEGGKFLTIVEQERLSWLGKPITRTASPDRLDDMKRHVRSVILKIDPETPIALGDIHVIDMPPPPPEPPKPPEEEVEAEAAPAAEGAPLEQQAAPPPEKDEPSLVDELPQADKAPEADVAPEAAPAPPAPPAAED